MNENELRERGDKIVDWVNRASDVAADGEKDTVALMINELDDLDRCMVIHSLIIQRAQDKQRLREYLHGLN